VPLGISRLCSRTTAQRFKGGREHTKWPPDAWSNWRPLRSRNRMTSRSSAAEVRRIRGREGRVHTGAGEAARVSAGGAARLRRLHGRDGGLASGSRA
jgi:hypothetical protein